MNGIGRLSIRGAAQAALSGTTRSWGVPGSLALGVSRKTLSKILRQRGAVTPEMALRLARAFNTTPELWLNLQRTYDLWQAAHKPDTWREVETLVVAP